MIRALGGGPPEPFVDLGRYLEVLEDGAVKELELEELKRCVIGYAAHLA